MDITYRFGRIFSRLAVIIGLLIIMASGPFHPIPAWGQQSLPIPDEWRPLTAEQWLDKGLSYLDKGLYQKAVEAFSLAISKKQSLVEAYLMRGITYGEYQGKQDPALADFDKAVKLDPTNPTAYSLRGAAWVKKGNVDQGIADYNQAITLSPQEAEFYYSRGQAWKAKGDFDQAMTDTRAAIKLDSEREEFHQALADLEMLKAQQAKRPRTGKKVQSACFVEVAGE